MKSTVSNSACCLVYEFISAIYLSAVMGTTGFSLFVTVIILHMHHKKYNSPVPKWLCRLLFLKHQVVGKEPNEIDVICHGIANTPTQVNHSEMFNGQFNQSNGNLNHSNGDLNQSKENGPKTWRNYTRNILVDSYRIDDQWKQAVRRIDYLCLLLFFIIFGILALMMVYPYDRTVVLDTMKCGFEI